MAKIEFMRNLTSARNIFSHRVRTNGAPPDPENVETQLARGTIWLTPTTVKGFNVREFSELPTEKRDALKENVDRFKQVAKQAPASKPPTREQTSDAMDALLNVFNILDGYFPNGGDFDQVRKVLEGVQFPDIVLTWDYELGLDSTGDPAVWIWILVDDSAADMMGFRDISLSIKETIRSKIFSARTPWWPYIYFRTATEQREL